MSRKQITRAFLPDEDPAIELPPRFRVLDELCTELPNLLAAGKARKTLMRLPIIDVRSLESQPHKERALGLLSMFGQACVHESWRTQSASSIPERVAVPWVKLATKMNRLPALTYYSHGLCNWRKLNAAEPIELGNISVLRNFFGGLDENWFVAVHVDIEAKAIPLVDAVVSAQESVSSDDHESLHKNLCVIGDSLEAIVCSLARIRENCDPEIFFNRVQPFMQGLRNISYEGVGDFYDQPQNFAGGSGAQSALMPLLDAALGIDHAKDDLLLYLFDLRRYMPEKHRDFLREVESGASIREQILKVRSKSLVDAYNRCVEGVATFRGNHLRMSVDYIQRPAKKTADSRGEHGTGGSPYVGYLNKHREETFAALV